MKELIKRFIPTELKEEDKSEAQKKTEERTYKYTEFFKKPLEVMKMIDKPILSAAYKIGAGFFINSNKLDSTKIKLAFTDRLKERKTIKQKFSFICSTGAKIIAKTALTSFQFVVRNSIKQPSMLIFRLGAGTNNLGKYIKAKIEGDKTKANDELANLKYQAQEIRNAIIGTAVTAAIIISTLGSAGVSMPFFGAATATVITTSSAIDTAALAKDTMEGTYKQLKGREGNTQDINQQGVELLPMRSALNEKEKNPTYCPNALYQPLTRNRRTRC